MSRPDISEVVAAVRKYNEQFADGTIRLADLDQLSNVATRLGAYKVYLGEYLAELERDADLAEAHREQVRERAYRDAREGGKTQADSDNIKRLEGDLATAEWIEAKYQFKTVANLWRDSDRLIDTLRSRLSYKKTEMRDSNQ